LRAALIAEMGGKSRIPAFQMTDELKKTKKKKVKKSDAPFGTEGSPAGSVGSGGPRSVGARKVGKRSPRIEAARAVPPQPEKKMPIAMIGLGVVALAAVGYVVFAGSGGAPTQSGPDAALSGSAAPSGAVSGRPNPMAADLPPPPEDVAAPPADAKKEASGLSTKVIVPGKGTEKPGINDMVSVHYTGWSSADGKGFDSSIKRGKPAEFPVTGVIKGWTEALQLMVVGEKRRLWIPAELAYGDKPKRPGAPAGALTFDVELLEIKKAPPVPEDLAGPGEDAIKTESGIRYRILTKGTGEKHPGENDKVEVNYSGWTKDGKMFDSSTRRGKPAQFSLKGVIKGWTEGVQLMTEGAKFRFWIPAELAYGDTPQREGGPSGELVFDIELLRILGGPVPPGGSASAAPSGSAPPKPPTSASAAPKTAPKPAPPAPAPAPPPAK
jgi:FKBP-type peptidyl-prolyl cis-trans isomerase